MHDLLTDPLIGVRTPGGERRVSLPELLAALSAGTVEGYTGLRAHQADPWHVFLVQLAASIQARRPTERLPTDAAYWRDGLLDLADGKASAWELVVEDVTQPAFLQHPWTSWEAQAADYGVKTVRGQTVFDPKASTPDELDVLITSKNHDVKMTRVGSEVLEAWLYALVCCQTMSAYGGKKTYGITRMNSGSASRPIVAWVRHLHPYGRFVDEVTALRKLRDKIVKAHCFQAHGLVLTWLAPWNRHQHQYVLNDLEPWFIEAARPLRLASASGALMALSATSDKRQIGPAKPFNGDVGDPWIPINIQDKKKGQSALTVSAPGFTPSLLSKLIFEDGFKLTDLQLPSAGDGPAWFVASVLVGGNCTTDGFYRIELPVPPKAGLALLNKQHRDSLGHLAQKLLSDAEDVQKALNTALAVLTRGGPDKDRDKKDLKRVENWLQGARKDFGRRWEALYFPTLWRGADEDHEAVRSDWQQQLVNAAQDLLDEATQRLPLPANRTWRAVTQAQGALLGMLRKSQLPWPTHAHSVDANTLEDTTA